MYTSENKLYVAHGSNGPICLCGKMANRHGLIAGATGTGKTVTLQVLAETFSQAGVPCFMADLSGRYFVRSSLISTFVSKNALTAAMSSIRAKTARR